MFRNIFTNKKVLITGNTGFKGSWLTLWLLQMNADIYGISIDIPTDPSIFVSLDLEKKISHHFADINDLKSITKIISAIKPDFVFHLAAQPIVSKSYTDPVGTIQTNVVGTANVLEALRITDSPCITVVISSDKCYENVEWPWGYKETDHLGGKDPYSASKGACEIITHSYYHAFFKQESSPIKIVSARSGNVIGGGDWAQDRLVPDCLRAWQSGKTVEIRHPRAIRPWQHVLEPLSGYLCLAEALHSNSKLNGEAFNFGPPSAQVYTVMEMLEELNNYWGEKKMEDYFIINKETGFYEAGVLKLNCDKALVQLRWKSLLEFKKATELTFLWYKEFYNSKSDMHALSNAQIDEYVLLAKEKNIHWAL